jgi:CheY-like chemotaxis protein
MSLRTVLLVDDDLDVHLLVKSHFRRLKRPDLAVETAPDGRAALTRLEALGDAVALVLSDVNMPRLDGHGFLRAARAAGYEGPFVLIGALSTTGHQADDWIEKDRLLESLPAVVERFLGSAPVTSGPG